MNRAVKRIITLLVWAGIVAYLLWASHLDARKRADTYVRDLHITVRDSSDTRIIRAEDVRRWIVSAGLSPEGQLFDYISRVYENMNDQLNAQYSYYSSGKSNCYDFAAQFAECPAVKYFRGKDLRDKEKDSVLERRREFWAQYFVRMRIAQEI